MAQHKDWFSVDKEKRAARVRSYPLSFILREALANSLDANATVIEFAFSTADGRRANREARRAFTLTCTDNGTGCSDPEILRRVGSSTSDLHPEKRGRFGQGLIDILSICDDAEILTQSNRILFDPTGCQVSKTRTETAGMFLSATIRHGGEGLEDLEGYFASMMLPEGVTLTFNGTPVTLRTAIREIEGVQLPTVVYDPTADRIQTRTRKANVRIYEKHGDKPMIHELGIPVDVAPWELPYDIDVLQKTPLDMERCMLPEPYKDKLIKALVNLLSDLYIAFMKQHNRVPAEVLNDPEKARNLTDAGKAQAAETMYERSMSDIGRRNPFDPEDRGKSQELETLGVVPVNTRQAPAGMREILSACPTVDELHRERCQAHFAVGVIPDLREHQQVCVSVYVEIASALLNREVSIHHFSSPVQGKSCGIRAVYDPTDRSIGLNIRAEHLWIDPLGAESLGVIVHECAHEAVEGHAVEFQHELQRLAGKLAVWVGDNPDQWKAMKDRLGKV